MSHYAGIWIDHRKAVIVVLTADGETLTTVESDVEKHPQRSGDSPMTGAYEARQVPADDSRQRALTGDLNGYYDRVLASLPGGCSLLLFGPGEAKGELNKRIGKTRHDVTLVGVETKDKMTDKQIMAKTRGHFGIGADRR
jgi:hypothetical protein